MIVGRMSCLLLLLLEPQLVLGPLNRVEPIKSFDEIGGNVATLVVVDGVALVIQNRQSRTDSFL